MRTRLVLAAILAASVAQARGPRFYEKGILVEMNAADCGSEAKSGEGITGVLLGTDSQHMKTHTMLCQEYVLRADRVEYKIRPKEEKHPALLPIGEEAEFRIVKDRIYLRIPEKDDRERQYFVTSMVPRKDADVSKPVAANSAAAK